MSRVQRNEFGPFTLDPPLWLEQLRRQHPELVAHEKLIWRQSMPDNYKMVPDAIETKLRTIRPAREHALLVYRRRNGKGLFFDTRFKGRLSATGNYDRIDFPRSGLPNIPGHDLIIVEHTHPVAYGWATAHSSSYVRGPSDADQRLARLRPDILYVIQALSPVEPSLQWFYYGPLALGRFG